MAYSTNPKHHITISLLIILSAIFIQITAPFIWQLDKIEGDVFQKRYHLDKRKKEEYLLIWINKNAVDSFIVTYPSKARKINSLIELDDKIQIWHEKKEIRQLILNEKKILDYDWFSWLMAAWGGVGFLFLHLMLRAMRVDSKNIKNYKELFEYYLGSRDLIMKKTGLPYNPKTDL